MNNRLVGLTALAAVLAGYVGFEWFGMPGSTGGEDAPPAAVAPARTGTVKLNPLEGTDPKSFSAIAERPLFNPTRQPRPAEVEPPPPPPEQPATEEPPPPPPPEGPGPTDYKLLGVSSGPDGRVAALRITATGDVVYLRKGESVDRWSIVDVGERSVAIGNPESPVTFSLFENVDAAPAPGDQPDMTGGGAPPLQQQPLPLPLPMPAPAQQPGEPPLPEQHTVPAGTSG